MKWRMFSGAVPPLDQLDGQLALADAAVAQDQDAFAVHLHQNAMAGDAGRQLHIQHAEQAAHQNAGGFIGAQQRHLIFLSQLQHLGERGQLVAAGDDHRRGHGPKQVVQRFIAALGGLHRQKVHLGQAHDLQPQVVKILIVPCQEQARAVDLRDLHMDLAELAGGVDHLHVDPLRQFGQRYGKIFHPYILPGNRLCSLSVSVGICRLCAISHFLYYNQNRTGLQFPRLQFSPLVQKGLCLYTILGKSVFM